MDVYNSFVLPTTCETSCYANFTAPNAKNLVVSKGNQLQIFEIIQLQPLTRKKLLMETHRLSRKHRSRKEGKDSEAKSQEPPADSVEPVVTPVESPFETIQPPKDFTLNLISEFTINGKIMDLHRYRAYDSPLVDYIIVSTEFAKLSVIKWDSSLNCISTVSLHNYESVLQSLVLEKLDKSQILHRSDPNGLCDLICTEDIIAFLPFKKIDSTADQDDQDQINETEEPKLKSILTKTKKAGGKKKTVQIITPDEEEARQVVLNVNNRSKKKKTKSHFDESFILNASNLNTDLKNIIDIQFLHAYTDPTIAILYAPETQSCAPYLPKAKDNLSVIVLSLELDIRKANTIMEIPNLPYDLDTIYSLQSPINGFVLLGANEIIHINSLGSTKGIFVNEYFEMISDMILTNQSTLDLKLENSQICHIKNTNEVLLITELGKFYTLIFDEIGGISNLNRIVINDPSTYNSFAIHSVTNITQIDDSDLLFLSCTGSDSMLIQYVPLTSNEKLVTAAPSATAVASAPIADINEDDDSWLYNDEQENDYADSTLNSLTTSKFVEIDRLINLGPCKDFSLGYLSTEPKIKQLPNANFKENSIIASSGLDHCSGLSILNPTIKPELKDRLKLTAATRLWTLDDHSGKSKFIISTDFKSNTTDIYSVKEYQLVHGNYNRKSYTIQFGSIATQYGIKPVQITPHKITVYNMAFNVTVNLAYEKVINYSQIFDHYIMVITTTGELEILHYNEEEKTLDKLDLPALLNFQIITNGWISNSNILSSKSKKRSSSGELKQGETIGDNIIFWLVTADNRLLTFEKNHLERVFEFKDVHNLPMYLQLDSMDPSYEADVDPTLKQVMFTSLGDEFHKKDYLLLLTFGGEIIIYETYLDLTENSIKLIKSNAIFNFPVTGAPENSYKFATNIERMMFKIDNVDGKHSILVSGRMSFFITKESNSFPRMFKFTSKPMLSFARMNTKNCSSGIVCLDDVMHIRSFEMDSTWNLSNLIPIKKVIIGETVDKVQYHEQCNVFIVSTMKSENYKPINEDDEEMGVWNKDLRIQGQNNRGSIKLVSTENWSVIDSVELKENEICTSLEMLNNMLVSDNQVGILQLKITNARRSRIFVGTGIFGNEDLPTNGSWKLFEIVRVNPDPDRPETIWKLRSETGDDCTRGPILSACQISGRFGVVQGQRMLVRTLKDDGNAVPVAFTDTGLCTKRAKSFENLVIIGDYYQGVEMFGFDADPYRMIPLSKDEKGTRVNECDFLAYDKKLFVVSSDDEGKINLMEYDPYNVESIKGQRLIHKTQFNPNVFTTKMMNVSRRRSIFSMVSTLPFRKEFDLGYEVIGSTIEGGFYRITPVADYQHRRLHLIQAFINENRHQWLGLNVESDKGSIVEMRHISRFLALDENIKKKTAGKLGKTALVEIYRDIIGVQ